MQAAGTTRFDKFGQQGIGDCSGIDSSGIDDNFDCFPDDIDTSTLCLGSSYDPWGEFG